jgi:hypothetical protein
LVSGGCFIRWQKGLYVLIIHKYFTSEGNIEALCGIESGWVGKNVFGNVVDGSDRLTVVKRHGETVSSGQVGGLIRIYRQRVCLGAKEGFDR